MDSFINWNSTTRACRSMKRAWTAHHDVRGHGLRRLYQIGEFHVERQRPRFRTPAASMSSGRCPTTAWPATRYVRDTFVSRILTTTSTSVPRPPRAGRSESQIHRRILEQLRGRFRPDVFFQFSGGNKIMNANRILFEVPPLRTESVRFVRGPLVAGETAFSEQPHAKADRRWPTIRTRRSKTAPTCV